MPNDKKGDYKIIVTCGSKEICNFKPYKIGKLSNNDLGFWKKEFKDFEFE